MKKLFFILLMISGFSGFGQIAAPTYYQRPQIGSNWNFDVDTVHINRLIVGDGKFGIDSLGRIIYYNNSAATAGKMLYGNGSYYTTLPIGTANQLLRTNAGATAPEWFTATYLTSEVDGSTTNELQNNSWDNANHEVDISSGTSAIIPFAQADGSTYGIASFAAIDFNITGGNATIDYGNGQEAYSGADGFLSSGDWTKFDNKGYTLQMTGSQGTVVDATTYFSGAITTSTSTTAAINQVPIPMSGTITAIYVYQLTAGTLSTGESSSLFIRYDNTTDVTVSTSVLNSSASSTWSATGLSQAVTAGHYIELKFTGATWATNPSNVRWTAVVYIKQ